jgi:hypothetical protein
MATRSILIFLLALLLIIMTFVECLDVELHTRDAGTSRPATPEGGFG